MPDETSPPLLRMLVAVDGIDGSGKSIFADRLQQALVVDGVRSLLFHVDDFRRPIDWSRPDRAELDLYYDDYYDLPALDRCLGAFSSGQAAAELNLVELSSGQARSPQRVDFSESDVAIVEGVFVRRLPTVVGAATVIVVETTPEEARRRLLVRDVAKGRSQAEIAHRIAARYFPAQDRYRAGLDPRQLPAVVVNNERPDAARLAALDTARVPAAVLRALRRLFPHPTPE